jgi:hypothetical protein
MAAVDESLAVAVDAVTAATVSLDEISSVQLRYRAVFADGGDL